MSAAVQATEIIFEECGLHDKSCQQIFIESDEGKQLFTQFQSYVQHHKENPTVTLQDAMKIAEVAMANDAPTMEQALGLNQFGLPPDLGDDQVVLVDGSNHRNLKAQQQKNNWGFNFGGKKNAPKPTLTQQMGTTEALGWVAITSMLPWDDIFDNYMDYADFAAYLG